jgi:hypothetical protein
MFSNPQLRRGILVEDHGIGPAVIVKKGIWPTGLGPSKLIVTCDRGKIF